ncbi:MAG: AmmeMemoRadiSam system protein B [Polyangiaceae bacterium]
MSKDLTRPRLRPLDTVVVPDETHGKVLVLRDTEGIAKGVAQIPPFLVPIVRRFDGSRTCTDIAREASEELGEQISIDMVEKIADELDLGLFLEGPTFRAARTKVEKDFASSKVREASHAGGAYSRDPTLLTTYLDEKCLAVAKKKPSHAGTISALIAPHIDPWRGALDYGHAYSALADRLAEGADTFILYGTSHAPMRQPFALCNKSFDTPLGAMHADDAALAEIAKHAKFDPYADQLFHKREHSLEFQVVFLKHILKSRKKGGKEPQIVPILAGLGEHQSRGTSPEKDANVISFLDGVRALVEERGSRVVIIAGADLAHVGPRFGDAKPHDEKKRAALEKRDQGSLEQCALRDASGFWDQVSEDNETRRVCGLAPIYALLKSLPATKNAAAETLHYEQTIDAEDGSIVSHASMAFYR